MVNVFVPTALKLGCLTAVPLATAEMAEVADMAVIVWRWTGRGGEFSKRPSRVNTRSCRRVRCRSVLVGPPRFGVVARFTVTFWEVTTL